MTISGSVLPAIEIHVEKESGWWYNFQWPQSPTQILFKLTSTSKFELLLVCPLFVVPLILIRSNLRYMLNMSCNIVLSQIWLSFLSSFFTHYWWIMNQRSPISILQGCELCPDILQDYTHLMRSSVPFYRGWLNHEQFIEWRRKFRWNWFWVCFILFTNYKMKVMSLRWLKFDKTWLHHVPLVTLCSPGNTMFPW